MNRPKAPDLALRRLRGAMRSVTSKPEECARSPGTDFTRSRKLPLAKVLWTMVTWAGDTIGVELERASGWDGDAPTASAFCQQRAKLRDDVMPRVGAAFLSMWEQAPLMGRFVLYGVDGTDVQLCPSSDPRTRVRSNKSGAEHNEAHPTIAYDIGRRTFQDMVWQGSKEQNEAAAFCELVDRCPPAYAPDGTRLVPLWLGDRGFYSRNSLCHLNEAGHRFILRMRDDHVEGLLGRGAVPGGCLDATVERVFVRTRSAADRTRPGEPEIYRWVDGRRRFDAIGELNWHAEYPMTLRVVRRRLPRRDGDGNDAGDRWLNLVTNLPAGEFPARWLVRTYRRHMGPRGGLPPPQEGRRHGEPEDARLRARRHGGVGQDDTPQRLLAGDPQVARQEAARRQAQAGVRPDDGVQGGDGPVPGDGGRPGGRLRTPHARGRRRAALRQEAEEQVAGQARLPPLTPAAAARRRPRAPHAHETNATRIRPPRMAGGQTRC